jgi:large subunit ribosomal protein L1
MAKAGKNYKQALEKVDRTKYYAPKEAISLAKEISFTKFDGTVEVHLRTGLDPRQADQMIRDVVVLPHGLGKTVRVLVFAQGEAAQIARDGGADIVADDDEWIKKIQDGFTDFDVAISTPVGKVSFDLDKLYENFASLMAAIRKARPAAAKGSYIRRITITTTMGPGIKVDSLAAQALKAVE